MRFIKIEENSNGSHCNQMGGLIVDDEWAKISNNIVLPDVYPFVNIVVENKEVVQLIPQTLSANDFINIQTEDYEGWKSKIEFYFIKNHITQEEHDNLISALNNAVGRE